MRAEFEFTLKGGPKRRRREAEPLRFLVLADFSGGGARQGGLAARRLTIDNLDTALAAVEPVLRIPSPGDQAAQGLPISSFDHFHPDYLVATVPHLRQLLELTAKLGKPATERAALAELEALVGPSTDAAPAVEDTKPPQDANDALFGRLLGRARAEDGTASRARDRVDRLIKTAFDSNTSAAPSARAVSGQDRVVELLNERCRRTLADPHFRTVERAWRGVHWLVTRIEDDQAEIHLVDVSKAALAAHIDEFRQRLDTSPLHRILAEDPKGGWDLIVGDYSFGSAAEDLVLLATIGALAARAETRFVAHGELELAGCTSDAALDSPWDWRITDDLALWTEFRRHPAARWVSLATPRFLLRHPYGAKTDPITRFAFEELTVRPAREQFFWGNPAFACALLAAVGETSEDGGIGDLPMPVYNDGSGDAIQPPLEHILGERARATIGERGLIAFSGGQNSNRIATAALRSIAQA